MDEKEIDFDTLRELMKNHGMCNFVQTPIDKREVKDFFKKIKHYKFIRKIFFTLYANQELLENPNYRRLYNETLDYLYRYRKNQKKDDITEEKFILRMEIAADLNNSISPERRERCSMETVNDFLKYRMKMWHFLEILKKAIEEMLEYDESLKKLLEEYKRRTLKVIEEKEQAVKA